MNTKRTTFSKAAGLLLGGTLAACGGPQYVDELDQLIVNTDSEVAGEMRVDLTTLTDANEVELRQSAIDMLRSAEEFEQAAMDQHREDEKSTLLARIGLLYYAAAENYYRSAEARVRLRDANVRYEEQRVRRQGYAAQLESERELITLLTAIDSLFDANEELRRQLATVEEQARTEARAMYAIQEARIAQREAEGMSADEHSEENWQRAQATLAAATQQFEDEAWEQAQQTALLALEQFRAAIEDSRDEYMSERDIVMRDAENQQIFEEGQRLFGAELAFIDARGIVIVVPRAFDSGEDELRADALPALEQVLEIIREFDDREVLIEGHTTESGSSSANMALSQQRASAVQDWLLQRDVSSRRVTTAGFGEEAPRFDSDSEVGSAGNDRVELVFLFD